MLGRLAAQLPIRGKNSNVAVFLDTLSMINVKFCLMVVPIELYPFMPLSVTFIAHQGHSSVKQFLLEILYSVWIKLKLRLIVYYVK